MNKTQIIKKYKSFKLLNRTTSRTHKNWKKLYEQRNKINENSISNFLNPETNLLYGYNFTKNKINIEKKNLNILFKIVTYLDPSKLNFLKKIKNENIFGENPIIYHGIKTTRSIISNGSTYFELKNFLPPLKKLSILEIGAGYGELARQIIKYSKRKVSNYDIIDLPNSILFCELYLGKIFGTKNFEKSNFVGKNSNLKKVVKFRTKFCFYTADKINLIKNKYDLIINSYSLGEMKKKTTQNYIKIINNKMHRNTIFISFNAVLKWDIKNYKDYNFKIFKNIFTKQIDEFPPSISGTTSIMNIFKKTKKGNFLPNNTIDKLGMFFNYGFSRLMNKINEGNCNLNNNKNFFYKISLINLENILNKNIKDMSAEELILFIYKCIEGNKKYLNMLNNDFYLQLKENIFFKYLSLNTLIKVNYNKKSKTLRKKVLKEFGVDIIRYNLKFRLKRLINKIFNSFYNILFFY
jgi:putative sugar O-methyltransferase